MQASRAKYLENLVARVQVTVIESVLDLHGSAGVMTGAGDRSGICPGDAPLKPAADRPPG